MQFDTIVGDRERFSRIILAAALAFVAIASFRKDRRLVSVLAGAGAVGLGYATARQHGEPTPTVIGRGGVDAAGKRDEREMRCAACDEPIVVGQVRRPNAENRAVHESCL